LIASKPGSLGPYLMPSGQLWVNYVDDWIGA